MSQTSTNSPNGTHASSIQIILVVEHEVLIRMPIAEYLRECGYRVFEAVSTAEAKAVLDADKPVDLVFAAAALPGEENGFALASWLRQHHPNTKVVLTSGVTNAAERAAELCSCGPLSGRSYHQTALLQRIRGLLDQAGKAAA